MKICIFPTVIIRRRRVKGINSWCSSAQRSSSYMFWNPDRKRESCCNAKLMQAKWNDVAEVSGMKGRKIYPVSCPSLPHICGGGEAVFEGRLAVGPRGYLPKAPWVGTSFLSEEQTLGGNFCATVQPPKGCPWLSEACVHRRHSCGSHLPPPSGPVQMCNWGQLRDLWSYVPVPSRAPPLLGGWKFPRLDSFLAGEKDRNSFALVFRF